jgi:hypothetical protein
VSIDPHDVAAVVVTRGDVNMAEIEQSLAHRVGDMILWDNSVEQDLAVYGRYAALEHTDAKVVLVQDDDVLLPPATIKRLLDAYQPGRIVANMPAVHRRPFYRHHCMIGFGAIFERDLPERAFARFHAAEVVLDWPWFNRTCDVVFTTLTPFKLVDLPYTELPQTRAENRMYRQPGHTDERQRMLDVAMRIRGGKKTVHA